MAKVALTMPVFFQLRQPCCDIGNYSFELYGLYMRIKILTVFGTRPEAIKLVPVIRALNSDKDIDAKVCVTFQHRQMLTQVLELFGINVDEQLDNEPVNQYMGQSLSQSQARMLEGLDKIIARQKPDLVLVHGDTSSCLAGALAAFYRQVPVIHIEAGLRTGNLCAPFPEEAHRQMVARVASLHLVPTVRARAHLLAENITADSIYVTGNTIVDALAMVREQIAQFPYGYFEQQLRQQAGMEGYEFAPPLVLITLHRRESSGEKFRALCKAILQLAQANQDRTFVFPLHLNPEVNEPARKILGGTANIYLIPPQEYHLFVWLLMRAELVITDSGGVQEEAEVLGKPVFILRDQSDRPESLARASARLVGTDPSNLISQANDFFKIRKASTFLQTEAENVLSEVFGDGQAAQRIVSIIKQKYGSEFVDNNIAPEKYPRTMCELD
ncbi:MAG TPA: UDP-N-acetylglucosamine 2-epimerase (non-hydrolyzing) [Cellvibrio sp.]|nr:UDP-N-acetylglucosamine 2-epimerase (non-hydrolyzing) [Cellvibrio sp.]